MSIKMSMHTYGLLINPTLYLSGQGDNLFYMYTHDFFGNVRQKSSSFSRIRK